jgi:hypothetical protein
MSTSNQTLFDALRRYIAPYGVRVDLKAMELEKPGEFDGPTITINPLHDLESRCFYLAHSLGSVVQWSTDFDGAKKVFDDLRRWKAGPPFEEALRRYQVFEQTSSQHAVWMLEDLSRPDAVEPYTVFFRADIEAMTIFHRTGREPRWPDFFAQWKSRAGRGDVWVEPFTPRPFPWFHPVRIDKQEVLQERD